MEAGPTKPRRAPGPSGTVVRWYARNQVEIEALIESAESLMGTESVALKAECVTRVNGVIKGNKMLTTT